MRETVFHPDGTVETIDDGQPDPIDERLALVDALTEAESLEDLSFDDLQAALLAALSTLP